MAAIFPKIEDGTLTRLKKLTDINGYVVIREKIDGSNFTVFNDGDKLHFYNKNKEILIDKQNESVWAFTIEALKNRSDLFRLGFTYHCEALRKTRSSHLKYRRIPRYHIICYEIVLPTGLNATPEEMDEILLNTGIEQAPVLWKHNNKLLDEHINQISDLVSKIDSMESCLGNNAEGVVLNVLNRRNNKGKISTFRLKFVATHMKERKNLYFVQPVFDSFDDNQTIIAIGDMFNVIPRFNKGIQRLEDQGVPFSLPGLTADLDKDLEEERKQEIMEMLWSRCWPTIKKAARSSLVNYLKEQNLIE